MARLGISNTDNHGGCPVIPRFFKSLIVNSNFVLKF
jgi:hypothetical protein